MNWSFYNTFGLKIVNQRNLCPQLSLLISLESLVSFSLLLNFIIVCLMMCVSLWHFTDERENSYADRTCIYAPHHGGGGWGTYCF